MRKGIWIGGAVFALVAAGLAGAESLRPAPIAPGVRASAVDPNVVLQGRLNALQSRITSLQNRVDALSATVSKIQPAVTFRCVKPSNAYDARVSMNSLGVSEDCAPFGCDPLDGRCRTFAKTSGDCALGFGLQNDQPGICVAEAL